jgi:hypothetical protein
MHRAANAGLARDVRSCGFVKNIRHHRGLRHPLGATPAEHVSGGNLRKASPSAEFGPGDHPMRVVDRPRATLVVTILTGALACGSADNDGSGGSAGAGGAGSGGAGAAACGSVSLKGSLEGEAVDAVFDWQGHSFAQGVGSMGEFSLDFGAAASGALTLGWAEVQPSGTTFGATGSLVLPSDGPHPGATLCAGEGSTLFYEKATCGGQELDHYIAEVDSPTSGPMCPGEAHVDGKIVVEVLH